MRKVFVDAGANAGQSVDEFLRSSDYTPEFEIHCFEPHPVFKPALTAKPGIIFHPEAVWVDDCEIPFYIDPKNLASLGASAIAKKTSGNLDKKHPIMVPAINFSAWILQNLCNSEYNILHMDIEGAEYAVLKLMLASGAINYVHKLIIEFHWRKTGVDQADHDKLVSQLRRRNLQIKIQEQ